MTTQQRNKNWYADVSIHTPTWGVTFYDSLGDTFTKEEFAVNYKNGNVVTASLGRLKKIGAIKQNDNGKYQKLVDSLSNITTVEKT